MITKGIKGIRKHINTNKAGWHIFHVTGSEVAQYRMYSEETLLELLGTYSHMTLVEIGGNNLFFS